MAKNISKLDQLALSELRKIYNYDPETGNFQRVAGYGPRGKAGHRSQEGYVSVNWRGKRIPLARLALALTTGLWPVADVNHINGDRSDNRLCNLRDVPRQITLQSQRGPGSRNTSGYLGVSKHYARWRAKIHINRKAISLGTFDTPEEAYQAYLTAKRQLHPGCTI